MTHVKITSNMKCLKYDSWVEYNLGLHLNKNNTILYKGPANECDLLIEKHLINCSKWLIIIK